MSDPLTVSRAGTTLRAWRHGSPGAPLVVFVHGGWMDHRMFDDQVGPVVDAGYQVVVSDLRGHGQSGSVGGQDASVADMAQDQVAILDAVGHAEPVCLVGQSLGGMVAQHVALTAPERVGGLVTIGAPCVTLQNRRINLTMAAMWRVSGMITGLLPVSTIRRQLPAGTAVESHVQDYVARATRHITKQDFRWLVNAARHAGRRLPNYRMEQPVLITRGDRDDSAAGRLTALTAPLWVERDPRAGYELIRGAGHQAHQDQPEVFNRVLIDFLGTLDHL